MKVEGGSLTSDRDRMQKHLFMGWFSANTPIINLQTRMRLFVCGLQNEEKSGWLANDSISEGRLLRPLASMVDAMRMIPTLVSYVSSKHAYGFYVVH
jgi:hypothetical protein